MGGRSELVASLTDQVMGRRRECERLRASLELAMRQASIATEGWTEWAGEAEALRARLSEARRECNDLAAKLAERDDLHRRLQTQALDLDIQLQRALRRQKELEQENADLRSALRGQALEPRTLLETALTAG